MHWCCTFECQWNVLCNDCLRGVQLEKLPLFHSVSQFHKIWSSFPRSTHSMRNSLKCRKVLLTVIKELCSLFHLIMQRCHYKIPWLIAGVVVFEAGGRASCFGILEFWSEIGRAVVVVAVVVSVLLQVSLSQGSLGQLHLGFDVVVGSKTRYGGEQSSR